MSESEKKSSGNIAIDCMLAMAEVFKPDDKVMPDQMFLALTRAKRKKYDDEECRPITEIFISELKLLRANDEGVSLEKTLLTVEDEIEEVTKDGNGYTTEGMKRLAVLSYTATMIRTEIRKKADSN